MAFAVMEKGESDMARYINEATLVKAIVRERDKIPLRVPCAPYELLDERPYAKSIR